MSAEQIQDYLAKSGKHAQLSRHLRERLQGAGWYDNILAMAVQELSVADDLNANAAASVAVQEKALKMIPEEIKVEMLQLIRSLVDQVVQNA